MESKPAVNIIIPELSRWQEVKELRLEALLRDPRAFHTTYEEANKSPDDLWQSRLKDAQDNKVSRSYFAEVEGKLVGTSSLLYQLDSETKELYADLVGVFVKEEFRGRHIASMILEALFNDARSKGIRRIKLDVVSSQVAAFKFYEKQGFRVIKTLENYFSNEKFPSVTQYEMELHLH